MARYIDAEKLCKALRDMAFCQNPYKQSTILGVVESIENFPTADVAPRSELAILSVQNAALEKAKFELQQELEACKGLKKILDTCAAELKKKYIGEQK